MKTTWQDISLESFATYSGEHSSDVVVVGGGITGISTAYLLAKEGKSVIVVEKEKLSSSVTAYTTAFLTSSIDTDLYDLKRIYGMNVVKKIIDSHEDAINTIEKIIKDESIECEFTRTNNYSVAFKKQTVEELREAKNILKEAGYESSIVSSSTFPFKNFGALELPNQAKFHPLKYLTAIRKAAEGLGVKFFENSAAVSIEGDKLITVKMENGNIKAKDVVIATYKPFQEPSGFGWKKGMYVSYVLELEVKKGILPPMLIEDDSNPYHYVRIDSMSKDHDRMIVGGQDHRKELPFNLNRGFNALKDFVEKKLLISDYKIINKWRASVLESSDGLAMIGRQYKEFPNRYVATAFSGNGMTYGTLSAMIIKDSILGKKNPWQDTYSPLRKFALKGVLVKVRDYVTEFIYGVTDILSHPKSFE